MAEDNARCASTDSLYATAIFLYTSNSTLLDKAARFLAGIQRRQLLANCEEGHETGGRETKSILHRGRFAVDSPAGFSRPSASGGSAS